MTTTAAAVAATVAANNRRQQQQLSTGPRYTIPWQQDPLRLEAMREAQLHALAEEERQARAAEVAAWAKQFDKDDSDLLERSEVGELLRTQTGNEPSTKALEFLVSRMGEYPQGASLFGGLTRPRVGIPLRRARDVLDKYGEYAAEQQRLDDLMARHGHGQEAVSVVGLVPLLQEVAPERSKRVSVGDAAYIISLCDKDQDGEISREELGPALGQWRRVLKREASEKRKRSLQSRLSWRSGEGETSPCLCSCILS